LMDSKSRSESETIHCAPLYPTRPLPLDRTK
jgi:hypothetical protein